MPAILRPIIHRLVYIVWDIVEQSTPLQRVLVNIGKIGKGKWGKYLKTYLFSLSF